MQEMFPAFLFPGQGAQYPGMLQGLYQDYPEYRKDIDEGLGVFAEIDGIASQRLHEALFPSEEERDEATRFMAQTRYAQPLLYIVELALARLWVSHGVVPKALLGHSIGEYPAAALADVFSKEDGLRLVCARGRLMQTMPPGGMLAVGLPSSKVQDLLSDEICLAGDNSPGQSVLSGPLPALKRLAEELNRRSIICHPLTTSHAFHSSMMDPILEDFHSAVAKVALKPPRIPIVSCRTGDWMKDEEAVDPSYWVRQLREAVRFRKGIETLFSSKYAPLLEVGPGRALSSQALRMAAGKGPRILSTARRETENLDDRDVFRSALASLSKVGPSLSRQ